MADNLADATRLKARDEPLLPSGAEAAAAARVLVGQDLAAPRCEFLFRVPCGCFGLVHHLNDQRDEPALQLVANVVLTSLPAAVLMLCTCRASHAVGALYMVANYALYLQRFMLTLHITEHRKLFRSGGVGTILNQLVPFVLCPLYGVPPGLYRSHHVVMHHIEDNRGGQDASSTEHFQRDNPLHFFMYWCRFWVGAWFEIPKYTMQHARHELTAVVLSSEAAYWAGAALLWRYNWVGTLWVVLAPFLLSTLLLMFGNWSQHVFVDPTGTHDTYRSTYNCLACGDNRRTYNDGYHILHHLNSRTHWSELPQRFLDTLHEHDAHDALVFRELGFFDVGVAVFTGRLDFLARHIVPCGPRQAARTHEQWVQVLRERLKSVRRPAATGRRGTKAGRR